MLCSKHLFPNLQLSVMIPSKKSLLNSLLKSQNLIMLFLQVVKRSWCQEKVFNNNASFTIDSPKVFTASSQHCYKIILNLFEKILRQITHFYLN